MFYSLFVYFFPISLDRLLVLNYLDNDKICKTDAIINENISNPPKPYDYIIKSIKLEVKKIYEPQVKLINKVIYDNAVEGVILSNYDR